MVYTAVMQFKVASRCLAASFFLAALLSAGCHSMAPENGAAPAPTQAVLNVRDFGARGDGRHLDSPAINRAIAAAAAAGGGTVLIPPGTYLCGSIHLTNNLHLEIAAGATILGAPQKMNAYDETEPWSGQAYQDGGHTYFHNSLLWGENLTNVFITGQGLINGGGLVRSDGLLDRMCWFAFWGKTNAAALAAKTNYPPCRLGNKAIALKLCRNVLIRDITIFHGGHFAILVTGCDNLTVDNVTMDTDRDGIDIDCCKNTTVSNCRINSPNDDGLCPKSTYALGRPVMTENLTIVNCQVSGFEEGTLLDGRMIPSRVANGRIKFGTESSGGFRNCTIANCTFRACRGLALEEVDGGLMENITINNLTMMDTPAYGIYLTTGKRDRTPDLTTTSRMRNIFISNVIMDGVGPMAGIEITGLPNQPIDGVRLDNIRLISRGGGTARDAARVPPELGARYPEPRNLGTMPAYGLYARHVKNLELANITTGFQTNDLRPALVCADVQGLDVEHFKGETAEGVVPAKFENVSGLAVHDSPALSQP
ncbi:MAG TPA: glycoside hydrolase family 28 protein [Verrucomicrobiae bacterium]|nr:glycoside hydrolase family 28 protein [Verrucomicrobiae bacterium]